MSAGWLLVLGVLGALIVGALYYYWSRQRALEARLQKLSAEFEEKTTQLAEATETLLRLAGIDNVTKLPNHSQFQDFLRNEWRRALREASSVSVIIVDIDHFRDYNEHLGHQAGDRCLANIADVLRAVVGRPGDLVSRFGGEEYGVVLSRTDQPGAYRVAHKICAAVEALSLEHPTSASQRLTVSVGVASATPAVDSSWEELELVAAATRALVQAKQAGRNRVMAAAEP